MKQNFGWVPDAPDIRDRKVSELRAKAVREATLPQRVDMRPDCSPIENQLNLGSCCGNAGVGADEIFLTRRARATGGTPFRDLSRLFLYKMARELLGWQGDTGATLRATMKALVKYGVCPETMWPYDVRTFDRAPTPEMLAAAEKTQVRSYYRCDTLDDVRWCLAHGFPVILGFTVYDSLYRGKNGVVPMPTASDRVVGGHAICLVGYHDDHRHFIFRNSWGIGWGDKGYGYLPYDFITKGIAADMWAPADVE